MSGFDDAARLLTVLVLLLARGYGLLLAVPALMKAGQSWTIRMPIALMLALPVFPSAYHAMVGSPEGGWLAIMAIRELILGGLTGMFFLPLFAVPRAAGTLVDQQAGLMSIQLYDPTSTERSATIFADVFEQIALFMFVAAGGFGKLSELFAVSHRFWPVASTHLPALDHVADLAIQGFESMYDTAIRYAAPFVVTLILLEYGIGVVGRAAPQLNILTSSVAIKLVSVLLLIAFVGPYFTDSFEYALASVSAISREFFEEVAQ
ncbi:type III secretion protein [Burkholderia cepacia]|uniref:Type III secretion protein n=1 Tax=Burkholderia cepacia TaxID=292 RepID=A0A2S8I0R6_BURCE|nr:flagellar biosynthetic protein FliR [Burkholderia cepacia]PQP08289.1 type III secretion protein [Burkholderia cepacia]HDR9511858.1 flagellar biosynthetic protein FliR [Burkholderia cepacia]